MERNAIILAAGRSVHLAPFTYERPKGLFCVRGEVLIERQIRQLREAGVQQIIVVVGYMKEKFFYLEEKFGVILVVNNHYSKEGNIYSLYVASSFMKNTYICCADQYFQSNPFLHKNPQNQSYRQIAHKVGTFKEFAVSLSDADIITRVKAGGHDEMAMIGSAYFNERFSEKYVQLMQRHINDFRVDGLFWEEFYAAHITDLTLYGKQIQAEEILEFDSVEELCCFDQDFLTNIDSQIIKNVTKTLNCKANELSNILIIQAGLTNVSFAFDVGGKRYVYRHPGGAAGNLVDRRTEVYAQNLAKSLHLDSTVIHIEEAGWKISHYVHNLKPCNFDSCTIQLREAMRLLRRLHEQNVDPTEVKRFDVYNEGIKLLNIASAVKGNLLEEFSELLVPLKKLDEILKKDAERLGYRLVLCHTDVYAPNFLCTENNEMHLIDWEYAGLNYPAHDVAALLNRYEMTETRINRYFEAYFDRKLTSDEYRHFYATLGVNAFYWFCWGVYKGSLGEEDGFFFLQAYKNCKEYVRKGLMLYGCNPA